MKKASVIIVLAVLLIGGLLTGCSSSSSNPPSVPTAVTPKAGSTYTYNKHETDSTKSGVTSPHDSTIIDTVLSSNTSYQGKSSVITVIDNHDTLRYVLESSGDVSVFLSQFGASGFTFINPRPWMVLPFGSKKTGVTLFDTVEAVTILGIVQNVRIVGTADYLSTDQITTPKKTVSGGQVRTTINVYDTVKLGGNTPINIKAFQTYSFDPTIGGYFHSITTTMIPDVTVAGSQLFQASTTNKEMTLNDYTLIQ